ncbi:MAG: hypothetical protein HZT43_16945 [Exiguobacterium profundum]|nr:MAG: hypothetical protein HZT43_16945 [Exiguobacterium profundum]
MARDVAVGPQHPEALRPEGRAIKATRASPEALPARPGTTRISAIASGRDLLGPAKPPGTPARVAIAGRSIGRSSGEDGSEPLHQAAALPNALPNAPLS